VLSKTNSETRRAVDSYSYMRKSIFLLLASFSKLHQNCLLHNRVQNTFLQGLYFNLLQYRLDFDYQLNFEPGFIFCTDLQVKKDKPPAKPRPLSVGLVSKAPPTSPRKSTTIEEPPKAAAPPPPVEAPKPLPEPPKYLPELKPEVKPLPEKRPVEEPKVEEVKKVSLKVLVVVRTHSFTHCL